MRRKAGRTGVIGDFELNSARRAHPQRCQQATREARLHGPGRIQELHGRKGSIWKRVTHKGDREVVAVGAPCFRGALVGKLGRLSLLMAGAACEAMPSAGLESWGSEPYVGGEADGLGGE